MDLHSIPEDTLREITADYLIGAETVLWSKWKAEITPGFDKFYLLLEGDFHFEIDGVSYEGRPGQLFFLPRNSSQLYHAYGNPNAKKIWFHALYNCGDKSIGDTITLPPFVTVKDLPAVYALFRSLVNTDSGDLPAYLRRKSTMLEILAKYLEDSGSLAVKLVKDDRLAEITSYIDLRFRDRLSVSELARRFGYSESYFIRHFKLHMGITPANYIIEKRIALAKELLQSSSLSVGEIANRCGFFEDANYFSRVFKSRTGFIPTVYRTNSNTYDTDFVQRQKQADADGVDIPDT